MTDTADPRGAAVGARDWTANPPYRDPGYKSTGLRGPTQPLVPLAATPSEWTAPRFVPADVANIGADLTRNARVNGEPIGERIIVAGRVVDEDGRGVPDTLVELWQANACGRYLHAVDRHDAPLDPNFKGTGRCLTDAAGHYKFVTIRPGAYPWGNHANAWRPQHLHFSLTGASYAARLVTQMYFPGDPLIPLDPIFNAVPADARDRLIADFTLDETVPDWALGFRFDMVLRGRYGTPMEDGHHG